METKRERLHFLFPEEMYVVLLRQVSWLCFIHQTYLPMQVAQWPFRRQSAFTVAGTALDFHQTSLLNYI